MRTFLKKIALFIPFTIAVYVVLIILWGEFAPDTLKKNLNYEQGGYGYLYTRINNVDDYKNIDILVLGSSHAYRGFDPRLFKEKDISLFNLGSSAQSPIQTEILIHQYFDILNPKTVIFEVYPIVFTSDGIESMLDLISNIRIDYRVVKQALITGNYKVYNALTYGIYRQIFSLNKNYSEELNKDGDQYIDGGFVERISKSTNLEITNPEVNWDVNPKQIQSFNRILDYLDSKGVEIILVQAPVLKSYHKQYDYTSANMYFKSKGEKYIDFNEINTYDDSLFYDFNHLNYEGVKVFNKDLIDYLDKSDHDLEPN